MSERPLAGKRVLVTRSRQQAGLLSVELARLGAEVIEIPAIAIVPPASYDALDEALRGLRRFAWLVVTSVNAVRVIQERMVVLGLAASDFSRVQVAAVGSSTARAVEAAGFAVVVTPVEYVAESLAETLRDRVAGADVLIVRAAVARDVIPDALAAHGARVTVVEAYRTVVPEESVAAVAALFADAPPDAATFTSSSTVVNFFSLLRAVGCERPVGLKAVSIGPITSRTLRACGWEPAAEADPHDVGGLAAAVVQAFEKR